MQIIKNEIMLGDCMDIMKDIPDKYFEIAVDRITQAMEIECNLFTEIV